MGNLAVAATATSVNERTTKAINYVADATATELLLLLMSFCFN